MKPSNALKSAVAFVAAGVLAACGQTGALYLPQKPAKPVQPSGATAIAPTTTVTPPPSN
ncbi:lipoprotein [Pseudoduganella sp. GCM10020061]|uniref:LPS translocon maturation chaperone LptM n=1 Tax=Pseudoduganella sp. GCM10020061 TaxID=3317345 RepID=UPI003641E8FD